MKTPRELQALYQQGENISELMRREAGVEHNTREIIEIAYDLQSGSYVAGMRWPEMAELKNNYSAELANRIKELCQPSSVLEAGVGEASILTGVLKHLGNSVSGYGFDLSWSRVAYAKAWLESNGVSDVTVCTGDLFNIPFADNSIDVVYTSHSIEPNGGNELPILQELYRVAKEYLILLEPGYELADREAKQRMESHGYCKNLTGISEAEGYQVVAHDLYPYSANPKNPTAITVIKKEGGQVPPANILACPKYKTPLEEVDGMLFSPEALVVYPVVGGIPCLRIENGIFASKYTQVSDKNWRV